MAMTILQAVLPDGRVITRKTDRDYKWLVCVICQGRDRWEKWRWSTETKLAAAELREVARGGQAINVEIVKVTLATPKTLAQIRANGGRALS